MSQNASLSMTAREVASLVLLENGIPQNELLVMSSFMMDFLRQLMIDCKTMIPDRDSTVTFQLSNRGYNSVPIPNDCYEIIAVGTQLGRYVKTLAETGYITNRKPTNTFGLVPPSNEGTNANWYLPSNGWGWGMGGGGNYAGLMGYGNGMDYGDFGVDWDNRKIFTSSTFPFSNLVVRYYTNCITPSDETCVHPFFITAAKHYLMHRYKLVRGEQSLSEMFRGLYTVEYGSAISRKNKLSRQTVLKIIDRLSGKRNG
jgi:hypothetical protein